MNPPQTAMNMKIITNWGIETFAEFDFQTISDQGYAEEIDRIRAKYDLFDGDRRFRICPKEAADYVKQPKDLFLISFKGTTDRVICLYEKRGLYCFGAYSDTLKLTWILRGFKFYVPDADWIPVHRGVDYKSLGDPEAVNYTRHSLNKFVSTLAAGNTYSPQWGLAFTAVVGCSSEAARIYEMENHVQVGLNISGVHTIHLPPIRTVCIMKRWSKISKDIKSGDYSYVLVYEDVKDKNESDWKKDQDQQTKESLTWYSAGKMLAIINSKDKKNKGAEKELKVEVKGLKAKEVKGWKAMCRGNQGKNSKGLDTILEGRPEGGRHRYSKQKCSLADILECPGQKTRIYAIRDLDDTITDTGKLPLPLEGPFDSCSIARKFNSQGPFLCHKSRGIAQAMLAQWEVAAKDLHKAYEVEVVEEKHKTVYEEEEEEIVESDVGLEVETVELDYDKMGDPSIEVSEENRHAAQEAKGKAMGAVSEETCMNFSQDMDGEYEKCISMLRPRAVIDNKSSKNATVIRADSDDGPGMLLEGVQVLTDLNLTITTAKISCLKGRFMEVFHVTDQDGNKITDVEVLDYIYKALVPDSIFGYSDERSVGVKSAMDHTAIELIGCDRPGLLSELSAVLTHLKCNVVSAEMWTHNTRAAAVVQVTDEETGGAITDSERLSVIKQLLCNVLNGSNKSRKAKTVVSSGITHTERRLHQMMFADGDYERDSDEAAEDKSRPEVNAINRNDKGYSVVTIQCKNRPKLIFDAICTLTDMQYVVLHGNVDASGPEAHQEYYIRHIDGSPVKSEAESQWVVQCLEAAIERRVSEGLKLELCTTDRVGLLSDVTRIFHENSLTVTRAEVTTRGGKAVNTFYVRGASGYPVDPKIIDSIRQSVGPTILKVEGNTEDSNLTTQESPTRFLFGGLFKFRSFWNFGLVRSNS